MGGMAGTCSPERALFKSNLGAYFFCFALLFSALPFRSFRPLLHPTFGLANMAYLVRLLLFCFSFNVALSWTHFHFSFHVFIYPLFYPSSFIPFSLASAESIYRVWAAFFISSLSRQYLIPSVSVRRFPPMARQPSRYFASASSFYILSTFVIVLFSNTLQFSSSIISFHLP